MVKCIFNSVSFYISKMRYILRVRIYILNLLLSGLQSLETLLRLGFIIHEMGYLF